MKRSYSTPQLANHGDITEITQITGKPARTDFVILNGTIVSSQDDLGSLDVCAGTTPRDPNCDPRF